MTNPTPPSSPELKACPFCGTTPKKINDDEGYTSIGCPRVSCVQPCICEADEEAAITAWNTRTATPSADIVEALAPIVARALAKSHGLGDHMPNLKPWMRDARLATKTVLASLEDEVSQLREDAEIVRKLRLGQLPFQQPDGAALTKQGDVEPDTAN